ncbi:23S rRNA pseudouridine(955/2504/2580) synthase RluC [Candidatus Endoriftia persephone]|jgi:23S rRNA pseudouridine955/2504/2580 synthase|uniref:Pseudouridine synthase n=3 Tax=Gammaproteobacteria TaxID=1236 RepID=G2FFC5_9GAMM|nr:23S rRNA pseudouridine(955/2504/2580) synthase RluC [Candidatus Endoriftia persephone]EGV50403.1 ribosomal large subunit pseudouridine synthase C [endosymbiont of Riftia pachyptila (vent Ph05)]EGW54503.1 ribosomal large subunit pseudouridine synthase C [endosymbiont of Tevnia jerichonana (vent Tica)]USF88977.1 23S rRNA pseudouridine(955/2504/2580) synthase RluC [Candidatus Endoriftia persephone]
MPDRQKKTPTVRMVSVEQGSEGQRIDNFLLRELKGAPRSYIYRILRKGEVRVNRGRVKADYRLKLGDQVRIPPVRLAASPAPPRFSREQRERLERSILFEDERIMVINKPAGMAVHGGSGLSFGVIEALRALRPEERSLELVHRLDRDTSGCLLLSKRRSALRSLHELMQKNLVDKRYLALLAGSWRKGRQEVDAPLLKNTLKGGERVVRVDAAGKPSLTRFTRVRRFKQATLVEAELVTGRTHQIRVHSAWLGSPILGDTRYGDEIANRQLRQLGLKRLFLHAHSIKFRWPGEKRDQEFKAPLPDVLEAVLNELDK